MIRRRWFLFLFVSFAFISVHAQKITYSEPEKDDTRRLNFDIIGKINGNFLIYKNIRSRNWIVLLDNDMRQLNSVEHNYLPENDKVIDVDFFAYPDFAYMIYQYRKKNMIHCVAAKIDGTGNKVGDLVELDTTQVTASTDSRIYTVLSSEDKKKLIIFKINSKNKKRYIITTLLMDDKLSLIKKSRLTMDMEDKDDFLSEFQLDNDGDLIFTKYDRVNNESIGNAAFVVKYAEADSFMIRPLKTEGFFLDDVRIKPDNFNRRYFLTSFYFKQRRGNTEGYYFYIWDKATAQAIIEDTMSFNDELRREAKGNSTAKMAFNDFFIRNIVTRRDGGFVIASESYYTTSRGSSWNRWNNYMYSPYMRTYDYYYYSPYYSNSFWGNRWYDNQNVRYQADNIVVLAFNKEGQKEWSSVIAKEQFDDQTDDLLSYKVMNTGEQVHVLFNNLEKRMQLLNDFTITPDGKITRNPTLKGLDKGYEFMPKYGKQVSSKQLIIPCIYRNYLCFAKLEY